MFIMHFIALVHTIAVDRIVAITYVAKAMMRVRLRAGGWMGCRRAALDHLAVEHGGTEPGAAPDGSKPET